MTDSARQKKHALIEALTRQILTLVLRPGDDLDEVRLSQEYGLSRTPLREVLRELAGQGYVDLRNNRGARVSDMGHTTLRDFFLTAPMIYSAVLRLAAENRTEEQIATLRQAQATFRSALVHGSSADRALANTHFHRVTGDMADNIYLSPSFNRLLIDHARIGMTFYKSKDDGAESSLGTAADQHDDIIQAITLRDSDAAGNLAIEHWNLSRDQIERFVMPDALDLPLGSPNKEYAQ